MFKINLLPPELKKKKKARLIDRTVIYGALLIVGEIMLLYIISLSQQSRINELEGEIAFVQTELKKYEPKLAILKQIDKIKGELKKRLTAIQQLDNKRAYWVRLLSDFSELVPDYLWVIDLIDKGNKQLESSGKSYNLKSIAMFLANLIESKLFDNINIGAITMQHGKEGDVYSFTITMSVAGAYDTLKLGKFEIDTTSTNKKKRIVGGFITSTRKKLGLYSKEEAKIMFSGINP